MTEASESPVQQPKDVTPQREMWLKRAARAVLHRLRSGKDANQRKGVDHSILGNTSGEPFMRDRGPKSGDWTP